MWKTNLNIDVELRNEEWATFESTRARGNYTLGRGGWFGDYDDPLTMLDLFTSYSANNDTQWRWNEQPFAPHDKTLNEASKEYDELIAAAQKATGTERDGLLRKVEEKMMDEQITFPIYYYTYLLLIDESLVEGVNMTTMGQFIFRDAKMVK